MKKYISNKLNPRSGSVPLTHTDSRSQFPSLSKGFTVVELLPTSLKLRRIGHKKTGFTIVELLVVIVVIGILAAITIVSYTGISQKAVASALQSDLGNAKKQLNLYYVDHGSFPTSVNTSGDNCPTPADTNYCLKPSSGNTFTYTSVAPSTFNLRSENNSNSYSVTNNSQPTVSNITTTSNTCPTGFIPVPGSGTYSTTDFCAMKYEAKILGNDVGAQTYSSSFVPDSRSTGTPWVNISQTSAIAEAQTYPNCTGCHLITEAEWMTIAQNVLSVASNWNGGVVGTSYIPRGNSNSSAATDASADLTGVNKRTLTLTNNEVIWDLAGNVWEWTTGTMTGGQPTGMASWNYYDWTAVSGGTFAINPYPSGTGISGSNNWNGGTNGIGKIYGLTSDASLRGFFRGGDWGTGSSAGVLTLYLNYSPSNTSAGIGFRVSQ